MKGRARAAAVMRPDRLMEWARRFAPYAFLARELLIAAVAGWLLFVMIWEFWSR